MDSITGRRRKAVDIDAWTGSQLSLSVSTPASRPNPLRDPCARTDAPSGKAFKVTGYTLIIPPRSDDLIPRFWQEVRADGRLALLTQCSSIQPGVLGLA